MSPAPLQAAISNLLDLHESQILPALKKSVSDGGKVDPKVLKTLEDMLQKHHFLLPGVDKPTLADVCIAIDLLSYSDVGALPGPVAAFSEVCFLHAHFCTAHHAIHPDTNDLQPFSILA